MKSKTKLSFSNTKIAYAHLSNGALFKSIKIFTLLSKPILVKAGTTLTELALAIHFPIKPFVKPFIFKQFCGGENIKECMPVVNLLEQRNVFANLHYGVEIQRNEKAFAAAFCSNKGTIESAGRKKNISVVCCKVTGFGDHDLLLKIQDKKELTETEVAEFDLLKSRMHELSALAKELDVSIYWDAEESWIQDVIDDIVTELMEVNNQGKALIFNTFQLYRTDKLDDLKAKIALAKENGYVLGAKIVRGAYIEKENKWAEENAFVSMVHTNKDDVDEDYDQAIEYCINNIENVSFCVATHNEKSCEKAAQLIEEKGIVASHPHVAFSQLYGMGDFITFNLASHGFNASKYLPFGPIKEVIPYLIRRAQENSSVEGQTSREFEMLKLEEKRRKTCKHKN